MLSPGQSNLVNTTKLQTLTQKATDARPQHQDSVTGGAEINVFGGGNEKFIYVNSRVSESNEKGEDQKKRSSVQKFSQTLVFISKFLRFYSNSKVKTKKKIFSSKMSTNFRSHFAIFHEF